MWRFIVSGAGPFPFGALVICKCRSADIVDIDLMRNERGVLTRRVSLLSPFTPDRDVWRDFGWEVQSCRWEP